MKAECKSSAFFAEAPECLFLKDGDKDMLVDWAAMSSNYANFAGILAGFVFSGIFLLLGDEKRDASEVISLGKTIYYGSALIATMFVIRTIPAQYTDEAILSALTRNLYLAVAVTEVLSFILSKLFRRKLDALFERYFIIIITATFLFIMLLVVLY